MDLKKNILTTGLLLLIISSTLCALEYKNNNLTYTKFWNLYNGGTETNDGLPSLKKSKAEADNWSATMKLNSPKVIKDFVGKELYFVTETSGDPVARLAPSFYVLKDKKEYLVWWADKNDTTAARQRKYLTFEANTSGQIVGSISIPLPEGQDVYYAQLNSQDLPFRVGKDTPVTINDIKNGLRTDWQHDIPGAYQVAAAQQIKGKSGEVVFKHFYLGAKPAEMLLDGRRDRWLDGLSAREKSVLRNEFDLPLKFAGDVLEENQYIAGESFVNLLKDYDNSIKSELDSNPYFTRRNYLKHGDSTLGWQVISGGSADKLESIGGKFVIKNKKSPQEWVIVKISALADQAALAELQGQPVRLSAEIEALGISRGSLEWQTVFIDVVQKDAEGKEIAEGDELRLPLNVVYKKINNYRGVFENEFIISKATKSLEVYLKVPGVPDVDKTKMGNTFEYLSLDKVALTKTDTILDLNKVFSTLPEQPVEKVEQNGKTYLVYKPCGTGLMIGDRDLVVKKDPNGYRLEYDIKSFEEYSGLYTNIFDVSGIDELEVAADLEGNLQKYGAPPAWATNTIEITYFDTDGKIVYGADYGAEKYPKINFDPAQNKQTHKTFFSIPHERGAHYAQIKMHFIKQTDPATRYFDAVNYFLGKSAASNIIVRPALNLYNAKNFASFNGSFYKHIDGSSLSFSTKGVKIIEDLAQQRREVVFENKDDNWSSLKTELDVPPEANVLRGQLNLNIEKIEAGLAPWEGFGFFLEADLVDQQGNVFRYSGIPAFQKVGDSLVRLERIARPFQGKIEYYIPLYHEHLKIKKLYWQLAMLGRGRVTLLPLETGANPPIVTIELLTNGEQINNPALWAQYGLYSSDGTSFVFQKNYQLQLKDSNFSYDSAEVLQEHLAGFLKKDANIAAQLKTLKLNEEKEYYGAKIKVLPSYARVEREYRLEEGISYAYVSFKVFSQDAEARYNFTALLISESGNSLETEFFQKKGKEWQKLSGQDVFDLKNGQVEYLIPLENPDFRPKRLRLIFGDNQGEIKFSDLEIYYIEKENGQKLKQSGTGFGLEIDQKQLRKIFGQKAVAQMALIPLENKDTGVLAPEDMVTLAEDSQVKSAINIGDYPALKELDALVRQGVKSGKVSFVKGSWYYDKDKPFTMVGFTIVGETFNKWFEYRRAEFQAKTTPYWAAELSEADRISLQNCTSETQFIKLFVKSQTKLWKRAGANTVRVHQLFSSWSGLDQKEIELTVAILKMLQKEEGFLIVFDMLPNTDFTGDFFGPTFKNKRFATDFTYNNDLFKATLVLPEVREEYIKPALSKIIAVFNQYEFWPDSISYCNETGFTHGFWTVDKNNSQHNTYFSRAYAYYYGRFLQSLASNNKINGLLKDSRQLMQNHVQSVQIGTLIDDLQVMADIIKAKQRVKDNSAYVYYNLLREDVINSYSFYKPELQDIRENCFKKLAEASANKDYYTGLDAQNKLLQTKLTALKKTVARKQKENAIKLADLLKDEALTAEAASFADKIFSTPMPDNYTEPQETQFDYIDTFDQLDDRRYKQAFFTSFVLPVSFTQDINKFLINKAHGQKFNIGLNNDFTRDVPALLGQAFIFVNYPQTELRFNKYTHHPVGGHSMLLCPGQGNVFDLDSDIDLNLALFTPPAAVGYKVQLSETNYTFAGDDNSGQGTWTIFDYLKVVARGDHFLNFHIGLNNIDKPIVNDYFNFGNRPFQVNALGLVAATALANSADGAFLSAKDFYYNRYTSTLEVNSSGLKGIAGTVSKGSSLASNSGAMVFSYQGNRDKTDCAIFCFQPTSKEMLIQFYGIERNNRQRNRVGNPNLVHSYGQPPIVYERIAGILKIKLPKAASIQSITGITPSGKKVAVAEEAYKLESGILILDTTKTSKEVINYKVVLR